jgi:hypothetical protein
MDMDTKTIELPVDEHLESKLKELEAEGWGLVPGVKPTATYTLCRVKAPPAPFDGGFGVGRLLIDDAGVQILPASAHKKN